VFPSLNSYEMYVVGGSPIYAPRLAVGLALTALIAGVNYRGIKPSGIFQDVMTFGLLATFAVFTLLGFTRGSSANMQPLFPRTGSQGAWLSIFLVLQIVPYFMTGFESVTKGSEEARAGFDPRNFTRAIYAALVAGFLFYVIIIAVVTYVYPWQEIVSGHVRTEVAFERTFGSHAIGGTSAGSGRHAIVVPALGAIVTPPGFRCATPLRRGTNGRAVDRAALVRHRAEQVAEQARRRDGRLGTDRPVSEIHRG
jgi:amino acid transporter